MLLSHSFGRLPFGKLPQSTVFFPCPLVSGDCTCFLETAPSLGEKKKKNHSSGDPVEMINPLFCTVRQTELSFSGVFAEDLRRGPGGVDGAINPAPLQTTASQTVKCVLAPQPRACGRARQKCLVTQA